MKIIILYSIKNILMIKNHKIMIDDIKLNLHILKLIILELFYDN